MHYLSPLIFLAWYADTRVYKVLCRLVTMMFYVVFLHVGECVIFSIPIFWMLPLMAEFMSVGLLCSLYTKHIAKPLHSLDEERILINAKSIHLTNKSYNQTRKPVLGTVYVLFLFLNCCLSSYLNIMFTCRRHHYRWSFAILFSFYLLWPWSRDGSTSCDMGPRFFGSRPKNCPFSNLFLKTNQVYWIPFLTWCCSIDLFPLY